MVRQAAMAGKRANLHVEIDWGVYEVLCQYRANLRSATHVCVTFAEIVEAQLRHMLCPNPMSPEVLARVKEELDRREQNGETTSRLMLYEEALRAYFGMPPVAKDEGVKER